MDGSMKPEFKNHFTVHQAQNWCLQHQIPFFSYRLPGEREKHFGAEGEEVSSFGERFVAEPFNREEISSVSIRGDFSFADFTKDTALCEFPGRPERTAPVPERDMSREEYLKQVAGLTAVMRRGEVRKVVFSRTLTRICRGYECAPLWFEKLADRYPDAFVFLFSVPGVVTWMGATPEIFLQQGQQKVRTMALAGTRPAGTSGEWGSKEQEEQQIVADCVAEDLQEIVPGGWNVSPPFTRCAGKAEHLCTLFEREGRLTEEQLERLRNRLHPTPAVGGYPKQTALQQLKKFEKRERRFYAGYTGISRQDGTFDWFVNLRSMEIFPDAVQLHLGGGITALSDPEKEWEETELKAHTLLDVL